MGASTENLCQICQVIIKLKEAKTSLKNGTFVLYINKFEFYFKKKTVLKKFLLIGIFLVVLY